jgi:hypothetical protein
MTCNKLWKRRFIYFGRDTERGGKPVPRYKEWILYAPTAPYDGLRRYTQDLDAALSRKHMHHIQLAHERVPLVHVDVADRPEMNVNRLHSGTRANVVQENTLRARTYERRVREPVCGDNFVEPQQRPGPELPTRCVVTVNIGEHGGHGHLLVVRRRVSGDLAMGKVTGQTPNFLEPATRFTFAVKDEVPVVVFAVETVGDVRLHTTN